MTVIVGIEVGNKRTHSALCVAEDDSRLVEDRREHHFLIRRLERLQLATPYPALADRIAGVARNIQQRRRESLLLYINATGFGQPIIDLVRSRVKSGGFLRQVFFTHGDRRTREGGAIILGKAYLVARLQMLLQEKRLHLPRMKESEILAQELLDFDIVVPPDANDRYGAFRVGTQDDLVTALGLAVQDEKRGGGPMFLI